MARILEKDYHSVADEFTTIHSKHLGLRVQLRLTVGFSLATNSLRRQRWGQIDRLDDCVVNRMPAMHAMRFSNEAEGTANLLLEVPGAIRQSIETQGSPDAS